MTSDTDAEDGEAAAARQPPPRRMARGAARAAPEACLSCGHAVVGPFCPSCGQKNDDMRRSAFVLIGDFFQDTFGFDSRMWRTLALMAAAPGHVPTNYSHGRRSRFTPPVRLFLVVSFLFFLTIGLTQTLFVAVEVTAKSAEQIERERESLVSARERVRERVGEAALPAPPERPLVEIDGQPLNCALNFSTRFFVRVKDLSVDAEAWRACVDSMRAASLSNVTEAGGEEAADSEDMQRILGAVDRVSSGLSRAIEDPVRFNRDVNEWLPRVMFLMTPILALLMALFIRGRDALLFDHAVLSLYSHAAAFTVVGAAIVAAQLGVPYAGLAAAILLALYFLIAVKRAYRRGWVKTVLSSIFVAVLYFAILVTAVVAIVSRAIWDGA